LTAGFVCGCVIDAFPIHNPPTSGHLPTRAP